MSLDILKMLIESACSEGEIMEADKELLSKKAEELGISPVELQKMIDAQIKGENYSPVIQKVSETNQQNIEKQVVDEPVIPNILKQSLKKEIVSEPAILKNEKVEIPEVKKEEIPIIPSILDEKKTFVSEIKEEKNLVSDVKSTKLEEKIHTEENKTVTENQAQKNTETSPPKSSGKSKIVPILLLVGVVILVVAGFVFKDKIFGKSKENNTEQADGSNSANAEDLYKKFMESGKTSFAGAEYLKAKNSFDSALVYKKGDTDASTWSSKIQSILSLLNDANELFKNKNIARAELRYDSLLKIAPDEKTAGENLKICKDIIAKAKKLKVQKSQSEGKYGFADSEGNIVIDFIFTNAKDYYGNLAAVQNSANKWGLIGEDYLKTHKTVVDFKYDNVHTQGPGYSCRINGDDHYYAFFWRGGKLVEQRY